MTSVTLKNSDVKKQAIVAVTSPNGDVKRVLLPHETQVGRPEHPVTLDVRGTATVSDGISGSLTRLYDGKSYLVAGTNVTVTSSSNGQVIVAAQGASGAPSDATYVTITPNATLSEERVLSAGSNITITTSSTGVTISSTGGSGGGGADDKAAYLVVSTTSSLANERAVVGTDGIVTTDAGAGGAFTLQVDGTVARVSGSVFTGAIVATALTGSLTEVAAGRPYAIAGQNVSVNTSSLGQLLLAGPLGWCGQNSIQSLTASGGWQSIGAFYLDRVTDQVSVEAILLVSSASLSGSVRLLDTVGASVVTGSLLGTTSLTDVRLVTSNIASNMTADRVYQIQAECFGGELTSHFVTVRNLIVRGKA